MKLLRLAAAYASICAAVVCAETNLTTPQKSQQVLKGDFKPPQVFKNVHIVRNTNLDKGYVRETVNVVIENVDSQPQSDYYLPFEYDVMGKVGGLEARDKRDGSKGPFQATRAALEAVLDEDVSSKWVESSNVAVQPF